MHETPQTTGWPGPVTALQNYSPTFPANRGSAVATCGRLENGRCLKADTAIIFTCSYSRLILVTLYEILVRRL
jgi:hypothetical protein